MISETFINWLDESVTLTVDEMVLIEGVEYCVTSIYEDGCFTAIDKDGEERWFEVNDIG